MKTNAYRFFIVTLTLFGVINAFAAPSPPAPGAKRPPPPPGLSIDENIFILLIMAILFGTFIICKYHIKTKAPI
jgi:hypothetical protein